MSDSGLEKFILDRLEKLDSKLDQVRDESLKLSTALRSQDKRDEDIQREVKEMSDKFCQQLESQRQELQKYNGHLEEHMKRSDILESSHKKMWERVEPIVQAYEDEKVVQKYFSEKAKSRIKWIVAIGTVAGSLTTIFKLMGMF